MQILLFDVFMLGIFAIGVGVLSSMIGIGGGVINTPLLLILFAFTEQQAPATALVGGLFVSIAASTSYWRQKPRPTIPKIGLMLAVLTVPGSLFGVFLRTLITAPYVLRLIFGISLMPLAIKMLFAAKRGKSDLTSELANWDISQISRKQMGISLFGAFIGGISAGLLGLGGGAVIVPVLCVLMGLPMHAAVATSMFIMMFTASAGTAYNIILGSINLSFALTLGIGMLIGGQIGARLACRVNAVQLKQIFGLILVLPLVSMMQLGQMWLDPGGERGLLSTTGDVLIWLSIIVPIGLVRLYQLRHQPPPNEPEEPCDLPKPE
ncbi:MAG: sulfite exporter TauE/SafE family protein [Candidatus Thorarchaeota archaeon]|nr:MAG: sulfite exporter TauE/SafE family protein [Candidatus Thorarchaeota archaeon]